MKNSQKIKPSSSVKTGDIIRLGDHVLACGDAAKVDISVLCAGTIDLILSDPPYAINYVKSKSGLQKISVDKDIAKDGFASDAEYAEFTKSWLVPAIPRLAAKNSIY